MMRSLSQLLTLSFIFNNTSTTLIYTLSLHDALPILSRELDFLASLHAVVLLELVRQEHGSRALVVQIHERQEAGLRSEEHTSELQSQFHLVCRLLLEKKKSRFFITNL